MIQLSGQIQTSSNKSKSLDSNHFIHGYSNDDNFQIPMRFRTSSISLFSSTWKTHLPLSFQHPKRLVNFNHFNEVCSYRKEKKNTLVDQWNG